MPSMMGMIPECFAERLGEECTEDGKTPTEKAAQLGGLNLCCNSYDGTTCEKLVVDGAKNGPGGMNGQVVGAMDEDSDDKIDVCADGTIVCQAAPKCDAFTCGANSQLKSGAASIEGNDQATCCVETCGGITCDPGTLSKGASVIGNDKTTCCGPACSSFVCTEPHILIPAADTTGGSDEGTCCRQPMCNEVTSCGADRTHIANAANTAGTDTETCCTEACSGFSCPDTHNPVSNAATTPGNDQSSCCTESMCNEFTGCGKDKTLKSTAATIAGNSAQTCCTEACSGFNDCPATKNKRQPAATIPGNTEALCCVEPTVDGAAGSEAGLVAALASVVAARLAAAISVQ